MPGPRRSAQRLSELVAYVHPGILYDDRLTERRYYSRWRRCALLFFNSVPPSETSYLSTGTREPPYRRQWNNGTREPPYRRPSGNGVWEPPYRRQWGNGARQLPQYISRHIFDVHNVPTCTLTSIILYRRPVCCVSIRRDTCARI